MTKLHEMKEQLVKNEQLVHAKTGETDGKNRDRKRERQRDGEQGATDVAGPRAIQVIMV